MLSAKMMALFLEQTSICALDTVTNAEHHLEVRPPRLVTGLGDFYRAHKLEVNDQVVIRPLDDGRYAFTPVVYPKEATMSADDLSGLLAEKILELNTALSAAELKELFPHLPKDTDVDRLLMNDIRLLKQQGRWLPRRKARQDAEGLRQEAPEEGYEGTEAETLQEDVQEELAAEEASPHRGEGEEAQTKPEVGDDDYEFVPKEHYKGRRITVTPYPREVMFPGNAGLNSEQTESVDHRLGRKAKDVLRDFGFRVDALSHNQLLAYADLGRRHYNVMVHLHPEEARLDWAALLAHRRETSATYVAVFGHSHDLLRLVSPAELARATLWSWESLKRAQDLLRTLPISPFDLESHFKREGLFEHGLIRFEQTISKRIAERGNMSDVLGRLASLKTPSIFLLEDVVADLDVPRDQVLKVLEVLGQPPFQMVAKVDDGEFCLRYNVAQGLLQLSEYALSLRDRLPNRRHERLRGMAEEDGEEASEQGDEVEEGGDTREAKT